MIAVLAVVVTLAAANHDVFSAQFNLFGLRVPTSLAFILALFLGFLLFAVWLAASGIAQVTRRWLQKLRFYGEREAEERYLKGLDAILGGRPIEAVHQFQRSLEAKPNYLPALLKLGDSYRALGKTAEATECHKRAIGEHPDDLPTLYALTEDALSVDDHEEAKKNLLEIMRIQPRRALKAFRILRNLYIRERNWSRALEVQGRIGQARVMEEERAGDEAFLPGIMYQIGVDLLEQDKRGDAIRQFEKVKDKYPTFVPAYIRLAETHLLEGSEQSAVDTYLDGYRKASSVDCLLAVERLYLEKGVPEEAVKHYRALIATTELKLAPMFLLGRLYYRLEMLEKADSVFREMEDAIGESGILHYYRGRIYERLEDKTQACSRYRKLIKLLNPFEVTYRCSSCGERKPEWKDFCPACMKWDTFQPDFRDELMQEIQEAKPIYYQENAWERKTGTPSC